MNLLEVVEKAKTAKRKGKEFTYEDTGVVFEFRPLALDEFAEMFSDADLELLKHDSDDVKDNVKKIKILGEKVEAILSLDVLVGFKNLTKAAFEEIAQLDLNLSEDERNSPIEFMPGETRAANELLRMMSGSIEMKMFIASSALEAFSAVRKEQEAQKKI